MAGLLQDFRHAIRMLTKSPGFTAIAVLTLALGIGSTTAIFSVIYGVLLRPLALPEAHQVVEVIRTFHGELVQDSFNYTQFRYVQDHSHWPAAIAAFTHVGSNLTAGKETRRVSAMHVSSDYFRVLGAHPLLGREFNTDEDRDPSARVVVLSQSLWTQQFGADPSILGHTVFLNGEPHRIVGVMPVAQAEVQMDLVPTAFGDLQHVDLWTTLTPVAESIGSGENLQIVARLKPTQTITQASAELDALTGPFRKDQLDEQERQQSLALSSVQKVMASAVNDYLWILLGAVAFVLLIACANISNLLLARGTTRGREVAVRAALGATRPRLIRQFLLESLVLSTVGGVAGVFAAEWATVFLPRFVPDQVPRTSEIHVDAWALLFALMVTIFCGVAAGMAPALRAAKTDVNSMLKENAAQSSAGPLQSRLRGALVVAEIALSLALLIGASLLAETFLNLLRVQPGFPPNGLLSAEIWLTGSRAHSTAELATFYDNLITRLKRLPGVQDAAIVSSGQPLERGGNEVVTVNDARLGVDFRVVTLQYFRTLRVPMLQGRDFEPSDNETGEPVAIVNEAFARRILKGRDPFTSVVKVGDIDTARRIVGVTANVKSFVGFPADPTIFIPALQAKFGLILAFDVWFPTHVLVRTSGDPRLLGDSVAEAIRETDSSVPVGHVLSMEQILGRSLATQRFVMLLVVVFAVLAITLAAIGLYGVIAFSVSQRTHELGIRMALGANADAVLAMVLGEGARLAFAGALIGLAGTFALHNALASVLFGVQPTDWPTLSAACFCIFVVTFLACYVPARRAMRVDPVAALRHE